MKRGGLDCVAGQNTQGLNKTNYKSNLNKEQITKIHSFSIDKSQIKE